MKHIHHSDFRKFKRMQTIVIEVDENEAAGLWPDHDLSITDGRGQFWQGKVMAVDFPRNGSAEITLSHTEAY